jgi:NADH-quinone oxidoreductase subunit J
MDILFYILGAAAFLSAAAAVTRPSPLSSALWLILSFLNIAGLFAMLTAPLIAALQVLIAAGAVMVLMLFVIMLVDIGSEISRPRLVRFGKILGAAGAAYLAIVITIAVAAPPFVEAPAVGDYYRSTATLGLGVLKRYAVAFEITGALLLAATVAAISLAKREEPEETQEPVEELETL